MTNPLVAALLIGAAIRIGWNVFRAKVGVAGEAENVAVAIAQGRGFADAYHVGQGATAHLLPISPGIGGLVYSLLGIHTLPAELVLATWSIGLALASYVAFARVFKQIGVPDRVRSGALIFLCISPVFLALEAVKFRVWEGGLAVFLTAVFLVQITDEERASSSLGAVGIAFTAALLFFVNPAFGMASFVCLGILVMRWNARRGIATIGLTLVFASLFVAPWAMRNMRVLGEPVALRSNAGLELALGTDPAMLGNPRPDIAYMERLSHIHPMQSAAAFQRVRQIGEVRYARMLGGETEDWIVKNPGTEARLILFHLRDTFVPEPWVFRVWSKPGGAFIRSFLMSGIGISGLFGLIFGLIGRRRGWGFIAIMVLCPAIALSPFQPMDRYIYMYYAMLTFPAAELLAWMWSVGVALTQGRASLVYAWAGAQRG